MKLSKLTIILVSCISSLMMLTSSIVQNSDNFKILRFKGQVTINDKIVKVGEEHPISEIENLAINTEDESGFVVVCYNDCTKNKIILEKTIDFASLEKKRKLLETTSFKTRGDELASFPELVNYFESRPILILGDSKLEVKQLVLNFPKTGSYIDLYYTIGSEEVIHEIPYANNSFLFKRSMFKENAGNEDIQGPIILNFIDPNGGREELISEDFYVALADVGEISEKVSEMSQLGLSKNEISEGIFDWLKVIYPNYSIDSDFVVQFVENQL